MISPCAMAASSTARTKAAAFVLPGRSGHLLDPVASPTPSLRATATRGAGRHLNDPVRLSASFLHLHLKNSDDALCSVTNRNHARCASTGVKARAGFCTGPLSHFLKEAHDFAHLGLSFSHDDNTKRKRRFIACLQKGFAR